MKSKKIAQKKGLSLLQIQMAQILEQINGLDCALEFIEKMEKHNAIEPLTGQATLPPPTPPLRTP